jgi:tetratricopeptide (TPR) repeat protein
MSDYSSADIERLIGLSRGVVRSMIQQRFVVPRRGRRREYRFSFQDLIALRTAKALLAAQLPSRRISRSLRDLRRRLPEHAPLSGLRIRAIGDSVTIRQVQGEWESDSGQYLLALDVVLRNGDLHIIERSAPPAGTGNSPLFEQALGLEESDPQAAIRLYQDCLELDDGHLEARVNCGRLLHQSGNFDLAESLYREEACMRDAGGLFNLGVLLEDTGRHSEALQIYLAAISINPGLADAHYNVARLYEIQGNAPHMIRHLRYYRTLVGAIRPRSHPSRS